MRIIKGLVVIQLFFFILMGCTRDMGYKHDRRNEPLCSPKISTPIRQELTNCKLPIEGKCPEWLNGTFVRNGPVSMEIDGQKMSHWFDGLAMLHSFSFQAGKLNYSNKYLRTDAFETVFKEGNFNYIGFDTSPKLSFSETIKTIFLKKPCPVVQNANVNVFEIAHQYSALTETPLPVRFNLKTADTLGLVKFQDDLPKEKAFESAHPQYDHRTGEKFNYLVDFGVRSHYVLYRYHPERPYREVLAKVPTYRPAYMHSFGMTEHYFILVEFPLVVTPLDLLLMRKPFIQNYSWKPGKGTWFTIIDRRTGCIVKKIRDCHDFFAFHHVNAYEENGNIILDIVTYPDACVISNIAEHGYLSKREGEFEQTLNSTRLMRYCLSPINGSLSSMVLHKGPFELPRINENYSGYPYHYVYGSDQRALIQAGDFRPIYKINTQTQKKQLWQEAGLMPGEAIFIARPQSKDEDEGVVLSLVLDPAKKKAFLLMLDARTFKELGRAYLPFAIPLGLHGQFFHELKAKLK